MARMDLQKDDRKQSRFSFLPQIFGGRGRRLPQENTRMMYFRNNTVLQGRLHLYTESLSFGHCVHTSYALHTLRHIISPTSRAEKASK